MMYTLEEMQVANRTCRTSGASAINKDGTVRAVVPKYVLQYANIDDKILDFGAGKQAIHTRFLMEQGFDVTAHDFGNNVTEIHDKCALERSYDIVFASNVLNTCSSESMLMAVISQLKACMNLNGIVIVNYPSSPRKSMLNANDVKEIALMHFGNVAQIGGTKSAPIWILNN